MKNMNAIYATGQVADLLGLTEPQLNNYVRRGTIPRVEVGPGGRRLWTDHDVAVARRALDSRSRRCDKRNSAGAQRAQVDAQEAGEVSDAS